MQHARSWAAWFILKGATTIFRREGAERGRAHRLSTLTRAAWVTRPGAPLMSPQDADEDSMGDEAEARVNGFGQEHTNGHSIGDRAHLLEKKGGV